MMKIEDYHVTDVPQMRDYVLKNLHESLHQKYKDQENFRVKHHAVTFELWKRGLEHKDKNDPLDLAAPGPQQVIQKIEEHLEEFLWIPDFISISGEHLCKSESSDVDLIVRCTNENGGFTLSLDEAFFLKSTHLFEKMFPDADVHYVSSYFGPNWTHLPIADLVVRPKKHFALRLADEAAFSKDFYDALETGSSQVKKDAEQSRREDRIKLFRVFHTPQPIPSAGPAQRMTIEGLLECAPLPVYVEKNYDGEACYIHKEGGKVRIVSKHDFWLDKKFPEIEEAVRSLDVESAIFDVIITKGTTADEATILGILYKDGEDLHKQTEEERREVLEKTVVFESPKGLSEGVLNLAPMSKVTSKEELKRVVENLRYASDSHGVVVKSVSSVFSLSGKSMSDWMEFCNSSVLHGEVLQREDTKTYGTFRYHYGLRLGKHGDEDAVMTAGVSLSTEVKLEEGDIIEVEFENLLFDGNPLGIAIQFPRVMGESQEEAADLIGTLVERARADKVLRDDLPVSAQLALAKNYEGFEEPTHSQCTHFSHKWCQRIAKRLDKHPDIGICEHFERRIK